MDLANSNVSVEFGHFSFNETLTGLLQRVHDETRLIESLSRKYNTAQLEKIVLIDDYNHEIRPDHSELYNSYLGVLAKLGVKRLGFESRFSEIAATFIQELNLEKSYEERKHLRICSAQYNNLKIRLYTSIINGDNQSDKPKLPKYSCAVLTACWYLCRLNLLEFPEDSLRSLSDSPEFNSNFKPEYLVNVLERKYINVECKTKALIFNSKYKSALPQIRNFFYEASVC